MVGDAKIVVGENFLGVSASSLWGVEVAQD